MTVAEIKAYVQSLEQLRKVHRSLVASLLKLMGAYADAGRISEAEYTRALGRLVACDLRFTERLRYVQSQALIPDGGGINARSKKSRPLTLEVGQVHAGGKIVRPHAHTFDRIYAELGRQKS